MCARGESAVPEYFVMPIALTPARARRAEAVSPAGPAPTTNTSVSNFSIVSSRRYQSAVADRAIRELNLVGRLRDSAEPKTEAHARTFVSRANSSIIAARIPNFL